MLTCDVVHTALGARYLAAPFAQSDVEQLSDDLERLERRVLEQFEREGSDPGEVRLSRSVATRYRRQAHTLSVEVDRGRLGAEAEGRIQQGFERRYASVYGEGALLRGAPIELEAQTVAGTRRVEPPLLGRERLVAGDGSRALRGERLAHFGDGFELTPVLDGRELRAGETVAGPAIVERMGDSVVIPRDFEAEVDEYLSMNLHAVDRAAARPDLAGSVR
jgi:N-methylhydantoinase A